MSESVNYKEIHAYMLKKTSEYYQNPPDELVREAMEDHKNFGNPVSFEEAKEQLTPLQIQRFVKEEMQQKWPEFMATIPANPIQLKRGE